MFAAPPRPPPLRGCLWRWWIDLGLKFKTKGLYRQIFTSNRGRKKKQRASIEVKAKWGHFRPRTLNFGMREMQRDSVFWIGIEAWVVSHSLVHWLICSHDSHRLLRSLAHSHAPSTLNFMAFPDHGEIVREDARVAWEQSFCSLCFNVMDREVEWRNGKSLKLFTFNICAIIIAPSCSMQKLLKIKSHYHDIWSDVGQDNLLGYSRRLLNS